MSNYKKATRFELLDSPFFFNRRDYLDAHESLKHDLIKLDESYKKCTSLAVLLGILIFLVFIGVTLFLAIHSHEHSNFYYQNNMEFKLKLLGYVWYLIFLGVFVLSVRNIQFNFTIKQIRSKYHIVFSRLHANDISNMASFIFDYRIIKDDAGEYFLMTKKVNKRLENGDKIGSGEIDLTDFITKESKYE